MNRRLLLLLLVLFGVKALFLALDSQPCFLFGDSGSYLTTALTLWIPPDRSFVYGFLLRPIVVWPHSIHPLVFIQAALSSVTSWLIAVCLVRYFDTSFRVAAACGLLCAVEPLQLLFERFVLTETISVFIFAVFLLASFQFLKTGRLLVLFSVQLLALFLISIRLSFLPVVLILSFALPLMTQPAISFYHSLRNPAIRVNSIGDTTKERVRLLQAKAAGRSVLFPLVFSIVLLQALLFGYRLLYGALTNQPPAYLYRDGTFLLSDVTPIVRPVDYPIAGKRGEVFNNLKFPLRDPLTRRHQLWSDGGLCDRIWRSSGQDDLKTNRLARKTAIHAIKRDPIGFLRLAIVTFGQYLHPHLLKFTLQMDEGILIPPQPGAPEMIRANFGIDVQSALGSSVTRTWMDHATCWIWFLLFLPLLHIAYLALFAHEVRPADAICVICAVIFLLQALILVAHPTPRYLVALAWLTFLIIGSSVTTCVDRFASNN